MELMCKRTTPIVPTTSPFGAHFFMCVGSFSLEEKQQGERDEEVQGEKQEKTIREKKEEQGKKKRRKRKKH